MGSLELKEELGVELTIMVFLVTLDNLGMSKTLHRILLDRNTDSLFNFLKRHKCYRHLEGISLL